MGGVKFRNHHYLADTTGTGWWRHLFPMHTMDCVQDQIGMQNSYSRIINTDPNFYAGMNSVWIQRWVGPGYQKVVKDFFKPLFKQTGTKLIYEIDDLTDVKHIPLYNRGRKGFESAEVQESIKEMLHASDFVVVTTNKLKETMAKSYDLDESKVVALPNLLPHWWIGDRYDPERKVQQFNKNKGKPRIGVISSMSHYNVDMRTGEDGQLVKDDMDVIVDMICATVDDFQWVVIGAVHPKLTDFAKQKKIEFVGCCPLLAYPSYIQRLNLQAVVAPLQDNEFNHCKSIIKYEECAALGIPLYASRMLPYSTVMPDDQLFSDETQLKEQLNKLKFGSAGAYAKRIAAQWNWLNSPTKEGNANLKSWWLEENLNIWTPFHTLAIKGAEDTLVLGGKDNGNEDHRQGRTGEGSPELEVQPQGKREAGSDAT